MCTTSTFSRASSLPPANNNSGRTSCEASFAVNINPTPLPTTDDDQWITTYLTIHQLSTPSYRYAYILWLAVTFVFLLFVVSHWSGGRGRAIGGLWSKWSLRRRTWRKQHSLAEARRQGKPHKQPFSLPSNAQLLSLASLYIVTLLLCVLGPDYIAPGTHVWDLTHSAAPVDPSTTSSTNSQPNFTISKAWWTAGGRTGTMAFALFPLCVLFALKSPPFALLALPFLIQVYNDKLAFLHRWTGRLIWFVTTLHITLWGVQLSRDKRSTDDTSSVWFFAFDHDKFVFGWLAFIFLTLLVALSLRPIRTEFYEMFYIIHILLVPLTLIFSALHFPTIGWWCWATLAIWVAERLWRLVRFLRLNGIIGGSLSHRNERYVSLVDKMGFGGKRIDLGTHHNYVPTHLRGDSETSQGSDHRLIFPSDIDAVDVTDDRGFIYKGRPLSLGVESFKSFGTGTSELTDHPVPLNSIRSGSEFPPYGFGSRPSTPTRPQFLPQSRAVGHTTKGTYIPPPGYAHCTLLPGRTIRVRLIPPRHFTWAPGQHVLLTVPSISRFNSHPFTIASICDNEASMDDGREVIILVRARKGFTRDLWSRIEQLQDSGQVGDTPPYHFAPPRRGVLLRAYLDGPFGSSIRARWTSYSTVLVIAGGSGVSFAVAILEYACMCMAGRSGHMLGGIARGWGRDAVSQISRVRFVWIVREFAHIQWAAMVIRRCMDMVPTSALQVDIFVTNVVSKTVPPPSVPRSMRGEGDKLAPRTPQFAQSGTNRYSNVSDIGMESTISINTTDISFINVPRTENDAGNEVMDIVDMYGELGHEEHELDLTNFDGEDDTRLPDETQLSYRLRKEGKLRRAKTRKSQSGSLSKLLELEHRTEQTRSSPQSQQRSLMPIYERSASHMLSPGKISQSLSPENPHSPLPEEPLSLWSPASNLPSPVSPHTHPPQSFLYAESAYGSKESSKSDFFRPHDSKGGPNPFTFSKLATFAMDEAEAEDMSIVAERARPGKAIIDRIVAYEAGLSRGAMVVACCGPTSLNAMVRKNVAAHISPSRIFRGDKQAIIDLVSEDFEW